MEERAEVFGKIGHGVPVPDAFFVEPMGDLLSAVRGLIDLCEELSDFVDVETEWVGFWVYRVVLGRKCGGLKVDGLLGGHVLGIWV